MSRRIVLTLVLVAVAAVGVLLLRAGSREPAGDAGSGVVRSEPPRDPAPSLRGQGRPASGASDAPEEAADTDAEAFPYKQPDTSFPVLVRVVDARGQVPLEGATVTLRQEDAAGLAGVTGADGEVHFDLPRAGKVWVSARCAGYVPTQSSQVEFAPEQTTRWTVTLRAAVAAFGRVVRAEDGRPVVDATVTAADGGEHAGIWSSGSGAVFGPVRSDQEGRFVLPALPPTEVFTLLVRAPGYALARQGFFPRDAAKPEEGIVIRLVPGGRVSGRVYDPAGRPVAGASVQLDLAEDYTASTDDEGRYIIEGLVFGQGYGAIASSPPLADSEEAEDVVTTADRPEAVVDLTLRLAARLVVRLVDEGGRVVTEEGEVALGAWPASGWYALPDEEQPGRWRFDAVEPGDHRLQIDVRGFQRVDRRVQLAEGEEKTLEVALRRGLALEGVVVDDLGEPVADASVAAEAEDGDGEEVRARTDEAGRFLVAGLEARPYRLSAYATGHEKAPVQVLTPPRADLRLALPRLAVVTFRLRLPLGTTPPGQVWMNHETEDGENGTSEAWKEEPYEYELPPGPRRLSVEGSSFVSWSVEVDLQPGEQKDLGTIALEEGVALEVTVQDVEGRPVPGATVVLRSVHEIWRVFAPPVTDQGGRALVPHLGPGTHSLRVSADGYEDGKLEIDVPAAGARGVIVLERAR